MKEVPKPILAAVIAAVAVMVGGLIVFGIIHATSNNLPKGAVLTDKQCLKYTPDEHIIIISNGVAKPTRIDAKQCDHLTVTNMDDDIRLIAFGKHDAHITYDGVEQRPLVKNQSFSVTLVKTGDFLVHDHEHDEIEVSFNVKAR